jgi:hypothetical protein
VTVCKDGIAHGIDHEMYAFYVRAFVHVPYSSKKELGATGKIIERSNVMSYHIRSCDVMSYHIYCSECETAR